jgi:hypothetical protein
MLIFLQKARIVERFGTQVDFSEAIGKDPVFVNQVVRNRKVLDPTGQRTWAKALGCNMEIFGGPGKDRRRG